MALRRRQRNETYSPRTDLRFRGGSGSAGSSSPCTDQRAAPPRLLALTALRRNQLIKRRRRLSSAAIWKESFLSFIVFFFFSLTVCLSVSFVFLCPLLRQQCRWIGTVSVRDLHVISWNAHPSKHKKVKFLNFLNCTSFFFFLNAVSLTLRFTSKIKTFFFAVEIYFIWVFGVCGRKTVLPTCKSY